jgi:hypothetical protein
MEYLEIIVAVDNRDICLVVTSSLVILRRIRGGQYCSVISRQTSHTSDERQIARLSSGCASPVEQKQTWEDEDHSGRIAIQYRLATAR